jgi:phosphate transport system permease protein
MSTNYVILTFIICVLPLAVVGYIVGQRRPIAGVEEGHHYHSTPDYYGWYMVILMFLPAVLLSIVAAALDMTGFMDVPAWAILAMWTLIPLFLIGPVFLTIKPSLQARNFVESTIYIVLLAASLVSILTTIGIVLTVLFEAWRFFSEVSVFDFLTGTTWAPDQAFLGGAGREQVSEPEFGALPLFAGTIMITLIAMLVAVPIGILAAVFMAEFASLGVRRIVKPMLEILAGIPTVVYGFFAAITVSPIIVDATNAVADFLVQNLGVSEGFAEFLRADVNNALSPGLIMGVMIIPFMSSLSDDVITAVPQALRRAAYALGSTPSEVIRKVVLPAALPGIVSAFLLSVSRAVGETMIVVMAAGVRPNLTANPLEGMTTVTVRIVDALTGDQEFDSLETLSAFGLGLALLVFTLVLNIVSAFVIRRFRQRYE